MPQSYQPIPIYDFDSGLNLSREPWLIPSKAFSEVLNWEVDQGVLRKRMGYDYFAEVVHWKTEIGATGDGSQTDWTGTLSNTPIRPEVSRTYFRFETKDGSGDTLQLYDEDEDGTLEGDGSGTIDYETGDYSISWSTAPGGSEDITVYYNWIPGNPILGIYLHYDQAGGQQLLIMDTKRVNGYFSVQGRTQDISKTDHFNANKDNYFQMETWSGNSYLTNNKDEIHKYDGSSISVLPTDIDGNGDNDINRASLVFNYKGHLVVLRPEENGSIQPHRARWTAPGSDTDWENGGYVDAPSIDWIVGASFFSDRMIVFFERSIWALNYIGDVDLPFSWEKLVSTEGCSARMSIASFSNELLVLGAVSFIAFDGVETSRADQDIPEYSLLFNQDAYSTTYGAVLEERHLTMWNYPSRDSDMPDMNLVMNYWNGAWSRLNIPIQAVGYYYTQTAYTWDNISLTWDDLSFTWDARELQSGYPTVLGGMQNGEIVTLNRRNTDRGADITAYAKSKAINPFIEQMQQVRIGYLDLYFTRDDGKTVTVKVYEDLADTPLIEKTVPLDTGPADGFSKSFARIPVNVTAQNFRIELEDIGVGGSPKIHAIVPWVKPAGRMTQL